MKKLASFLLVAVTMLPGIVSAESFTRFLTVGSRGNDVMQLQVRLQAGGFLSVAPTGYYGQLTRLAVMAFQKKNNLEQVGSVGPKTRGLLNASLMTSQITPPPPSAPATPQAENVSTQSSSSPTTSASAVNPPSSTSDAPKVTLVSPKTIVPRNSFQIDFIVNTDKPALCRYDTVPNREFRFMKPYAITGETTHTSILTSFAVDGLYIYYVRCVDMYDRQSQEMTVTFSVTGQ